MEALLKELEIKLRSLIDQHLDLTESSRQLASQKDNLLNKQKLAISQIENLISKLKTIEKNP